MRRRWAVCFLLNTNTIFFSILSPKCWLGFTFLEQNDDARPGAYLFHSQSSKATKSTSSSTFGESVLLCKERELFLSTFSFFCLTDRQILLFSQGRWWRRWSRLTWLDFAFIKEGGRKLEFCLVQGFDNTEEPDGVHFRF